MIKLPIIEINKLGLVCCEKSTGVVLNLDWTRFLGNSEIPIRIFHSKSEIIEFIEYVKKEHVEFLVYNHQHRLIELIY